MTQERPRPRRLVVRRHRWLRGADLSSVCLRFPRKEPGKSWVLSGKPLDRPSFRLRRIYVPVGSAPEEPGLPASPSRCRTVFRTEASCPSPSSPSIVMTDGIGH